jgi:predicted RNA-binding Zn-ribbon protein involved in translation (DUF1610 family)
MDHKLRLDGNAAAGSLREIFTFEVTTAQYACEGCGRVAHIGEAMAHMSEIGTIVRCPKCDNVLIRLAHNRNRLWMARCCFRSGFGSPRGARVRSRLPNTSAPSVWSRVARTHAPAHGSRTLVPPSSCSLPRYVALTSYPSPAASLSRST